MPQDENRYLPPEDENREPQRGSETPGGPQDWARQESGRHQTWDRDGEEHRSEPEPGTGDDEQDRNDAERSEIHLELDNPEIASVDGNIDDPERFPGIEDSPLGFVRVDTDKEAEQPDRGRSGDRSVDQPVEERNVDFITVGTDSEAVMAEMEDYTSDEAVLSDFAERQEVAYGSDELLNQLREHTSQSPNLSGDDIDAAWDRSDQAGEESVGGSAPTPDQDIVEELGEAMGIQYEDSEPLNTEEKLRQRDENRWELDPASADELDLEAESRSRFAVLDGADAIEGEEEIDLVDYLEEIDEDDDEDVEDEDAMIESLDDEDRRSSAYAADKDDGDLDEEEAGLTSDEYGKDDYDEEDDGEGYDDAELDDLADDFLLGGLDDDDY